MDSIADLIEKEERRQIDMISLIASENITSGAVRAALGSRLTDKYAEGKPHHRYYFGNDVADAIEERVKALALSLFGLKESEWGVNVQPYSGSIANLAAYLAVLEKGDRVLALSLEHGGHLTHGHTVSFTGKLFDFYHYSVGADGFIDYDAVRVLAEERKPKLIVCGTTAYSRAIDFSAFRDIADSIGALLLADISHIAGLVAGSAHPSPFPHADIVTSTTQKTLRGPRGAFVISRKNYSDAVDKALFPGLQGGPHLNTIAAIGVAFEEALDPGFADYANQVVRNARVLAEQVGEFAPVVTGGTDTHLFLADVTPLGLSGKVAGEMLEQAGIILNKNMIPYDARTPWDPSGIRCGTSSVTSRGMKESEMEKIASLVRAVVEKTRSIDEVRADVCELASSFPLR